MQLGRVWEGTIVGKSIVLLDNAGCATAPCSWVDYERELWMSDHGASGPCKVTPLCEWTMQVVLMDHATSVIVIRNHGGQCMVLVDHGPCKSYHCGNGQCRWCSCNMQLGRLWEGTIVGKCMVLLDNASQTIVWKDNAGCASIPCS